jgi:O-succinylbenzoic acid--CoA ligase
MANLNLDWQSTESHFFINPRLPDQEVLSQRVSRVLNEFPGHIFLLSSGTTAQSVDQLKWVALSKNAFLASAQSINFHLKSDSQDLWLHVLPEFHVGGLGIWARSHLSGAQVVALKRWNASEFLEQARSHHATLSALVPAQIYDLVMTRELCPTSFRAIIVGGGALSESLYQQARKLGWPLLPSYGMTEACSQIATTRLEDLNSLTAIPPLHVLSHLEVREAEGGRLQVRGESLLSAYIFHGFNQPEIRDPKVGGWLTSEDRGSVHLNQLQILGRTGDFVKIGGESVEMGRLRAILDELRLGFSLCADLALVPVPDERLGHVVHLFSDPSLTDAQWELLTHAYHQRVAPFEKLRGWTILPQLPRTPLGKLIPAECIRQMKS